MPASQSAGLTLLSSSCFEALPALEKLFIGDDLAIEVVVVGLEGETDFNGENVDFEGDFLIGDLDGEFLCLISDFAGDAHSTGIILDFDGDLGFLVNVPLS